MKELMIEDLDCEADGIDCARTGHTQCWDCNAIVCGECMVYAGGHDRCPECAAKLVQAEKVAA